MPARDPRCNAARWRGFDLACALVALAAAVAIYRGWRPHGGLWLNLPRTPYDAILVAFAGHHPIASWARYSVPDALWQYAFGATMGAVWRGEPWTRSKAAFIAAPAVLGLLVELGQSLGIVAGTFDVADLAASAASALLAVVLHGGISRRAPAKPHPVRGGCAVSMTDVAPAVRRLALERPRRLARSPGRR